MTRPQLGAAPAQRPHAILHRGPRTVRALNSTSSTSVSRGVLILPGLGNNAADYAPLAAQLEARGMSVEVAQVTRLDWSRNAAALTDPNWWRGTLKPRPAVDWYLTRVDAAMQRLKRRVEAEEAPISVLTHSAGGWLGRVYLLDWGTAGVDRFVSLGSPHTPAPAGSAAIDQTRGILTWVNDASPGAFHSSIQYVTICGKFIRGAPLFGQAAATAAAAAASAAAAAGGSAAERTEVAAAVAEAAAEGGPRRLADFLAKFAGAGYQQVCGEAEVWGDFIVPQPSAHLEGAQQVDLAGVFHSPLGEQLPFFGPWYGSQQVLDQWLHHLTGEPPSGGQQAAAAAAAVAAAAPYRSSSSGE